MNDDGGSIIIIITSSIAGVRGSPGRSATVWPNTRRSA